MTSVALARNAMASRFEIVLFGEDASRLRAAGEEALDEVARIEAQLSVYRPSSEISHVNARGSIEPVRVSPPVFSLLVRARKLWEETGGAFDITMGLLIKAWGFMDDSPRTPSRAELNALLENIGTGHMELDSSRYTVRFHRPGMMIDLGAIGKGYAVEEATAILREAGVERALIHGGTSTVFGLGAPPGADGWIIGIEDPSRAFGGSVAQNTVIRLEGRSHTPDSGHLPKVLREVVLRDQALSVSSAGGKFFRAGDAVLGHVIDPRNGEPVHSAGLAAAVLNSPTESDAFSTALLVLGAEGVPKLAALRAGMQAFVTEH